MFPLLQFGSTAVQLPGLILLLCLWLGLNIAEKQTKKQGHSGEHIYLLLMVGLVAGALTARLWYVGRYLDTYLADPMGIIALDTNTIDPTAGLVAALAAAILAGAWKKMKLRPTLDNLAPGLAFFSIGIGLSHLSSGSAFGAPTNVPWAIQLWDAARHPTQIYEIIFAAAIFGLVWRAGRGSQFSGYPFLLWAALTAASRLFLEAFRGDSIIVAGGVRQPQLAALIILLITLWLMRQWSRPVSHLA